MWHRQSKIIDVDGVQCCLLQKTLGIEASVARMQSASYLKKTAEEFVLVDCGIYILSQCLKVLDNGVWRFATTDEISEMTHAQFSNLLHEINLLSEYGILKQSDKLKQYCYELFESGMKMPEAVSKWLIDNAPESNRVQKKMPLRPSMTA